MGNFARAEGKSPDIIVKVLYLYRSERTSVLTEWQEGAGPDTALYGLNHLRKYGIQGDFFDEDRVLGFTPWWLQQPGKLLILKTNLGWNIGQALQSLKRIKAYDSVFATTDSTGLPLAFLKRLGLFHKPLIMASQGLCQNLENQGWSWAFRVHRWSMRAVDCFIVYGWSEKMELTQKFGVPEEKITFVPFGVDVPFFAPKDSCSLKNSEDFILSVGRDRSRDFALLLKVAACLPFRFIIITAKGRLDRLPIPDNVQVLYNLPIHEVQRYYAACRFVILPVQQSSYSFATTTLMDCLAMRKAVIASRTTAVGPGTAGYGLRDGVHCRFVPVGDVNTLTDAIKELWDSPEECQKLGDGGGRYVQQFTSDIYAQGLSQIFWKAANGVRQSSLP